MQGHIHRRVHTTNDGRTTTTWYVVVDRERDKNGKRRQKWHGGFATRKEAEAARAKIVNDINTGDYISATTTTVETYLRNTWLPTVRARLKSSTWDSYSRNLELHVYPPLGTVALQRLTGASLNALYAELLLSGRRNGPGGLSARSVRYIHTILHKAFSDALDTQLIRYNPAERAKPPKPEKSTGNELRFWQPHELRRYLASVRGTRLYAAWHLSAMTGMRRGEVLGLRWKDVDLDRARLSVRHTIISVAYEMKESTPKTHRPRVIDLDPATVEVLRGHQASQAEEQAARGAGCTSQDLVFARENGTPIHPERFSQLFDLEVKRSGLPRIRLHDLRHTHATIALRAGVPVKVISERLGHESPAFTLRQYAHVMPGMQAEAAALVAAAVLAREQSPCNS